MFLRCCLIIRKLLLQICMRNNIYHEFLTSIILFTRYIIKCFKRRTFLFNKRIFFLNISHFFHSCSLGFFLLSIFNYFFMFQIYELPNAIKIFFIVIFHKNFIIFINKTSFVKIFVKSDYFKRKLY